MADYIFHHGIKGMHWGIRRFRNEDGSLTDAGKRRQANLPDIATASREGSNAFGRGASIANRSAARKQQRAMNKMGDSVSKMTDQQLRDAVNRLNLERQYKSLKAEDVGRGRQYVSSILSTAGDVAAVGASAATIALAIMQIRNKKFGVT